MYADLYQNQFYKLVYSWLVNEYEVSYVSIIVSFQIETNKMNRLVISTELNIRKCVALIVSC